MSSYNIFKDFTSSYVLTQGVGAVYGPLQIYGNLLYVENLQSSASMMELKWYPQPSSYTELDDSTWENWSVLNNTIINTDPTGVSVGQGVFGIAKRDNLLKNAHLKNFVIKNNLIVNDVPRAYFGGVPHGVDKAGTGSWQWGIADVAFDYNIISGNAPKRIGYFGTRWQDAEALSAGTIYKNNSSLRPLFADFANHNYRLQAADTIARNRGKSLDYLALPGLETDMDGVRRGWDNSWDIGSFEHCGNECRSQRTPGVPRDLRVGDTG